jgi:mono/diheme cytochrome c family protein
VKAPARVLFVSTLIALLVIVVVLYRYDLLKFGSSGGGESASNNTAAPAGKASETPSASGSTATPEQLANGKKLYETATCVLCHGATGAADNPMGQALKATNLALGQFKDNKENLPSVEYIAKVIAEGVPGTGMASFKGQVPSEKDRHDLAEFVHSLSVKK